MLLLTFTKNKWKFCKEIDAKAKVKDLWSTCDFWKSFKGMECPPPPLLSIKTVSVGICARIIRPTVRLSKRGFVSINQLLLGCQIKYRRARQRIVQIYISVVFPVISRLLGSRAHNSGRDWMENIFYLNGNLENGAFQPNVFDCKRFQRAMSRRIYRIYEEHSLCLFSVFSVALYCKIKQQTPKDQISWVCIWKFKTTSNFPESLCGQCGRLNVRNGGKFKCIE